MSVATKPLPASASIPVHDEFARELAALIIEALGLEDIDATTVELSAPLFGAGLGLDSLDMLEIALVVQQRHGVKLKSDDPDNPTIFASLQSLADFIEATRAAQA